MDLKSIVEKSRELTIEEKKRVLVFLKHTYDMSLRGGGLCIHAKRAYYGGKISHDQYIFFKKLLRNRYESLGYSYGLHGERLGTSGGYYWLKGDKEARIDWIDEQIKLVENGEYKTIDKRD